MSNCRICKKETQMLTRCEEHYMCDGCGTREDLCLYVHGLWCSACHKKNMDKKIAAFNDDTDCTDEVTCPWCGYVHSDSWEFSEGKEIDCSDCGNEFAFERIIDVQYSTRK